MNKINYLVGDATNPIGDGIKIIAHISNDSNKWGAGFVIALSKKWKQPEETYRKSNVYNLGDVQFVKVENDIYVANMIAQHGVGLDNNKKSPIRYDALYDCLKEINDIARNLNASIHAPRFGSGLAGGNWNIIEQIILEVIDVPIYIYDLPSNK